MIKYIGRLLERIIHPKPLYRYLVKRKLSGLYGRLYVGGYTLIASTAKVFLGDNVCFNGMKILGRGKCTIGDNFHSGTDCQIMTDYHNYDMGTKIPYDETFIVKDVVIGDNVWLGNNVIILPGVTIGEGAIIQAGSVVVCNISPLSIAGGHPAKVFKVRDKVHYEDKKRNKQFY